ncbi:MAG: glycosyltransferase family 9 protein [Chloroflexota bacterium]|nr:glycosyltransferase family 9 protein [Chloroflexota bacterium]MDQ5867521.1 glycosyltransferase family 9 protein [Chloroflexota bacterium]
MQPQYKRILAVKLADMGDLLTITPALQALRAAHPAARIDLLVPPRSADLLKDAPYVDRIVTFDKFAFDSLRGLLDVRGIAKTVSFLARLRASRYDGMAIFHHYTSRWGTLKFAVLALASGSRIRAGIDNGRGRFLTHRASDEGFGAMHEAEYWLSVAALLGANAGSGWRSRIPVGESDKAATRSLLSYFGKERATPLLAIHPGAGAYSPARIWPVEGFGMVAKGLIKSHGANVVILGGPDEVEAASKLERLVGETGRVLNLAGRTSIHQTAAVLEECDLFLGNDSGPMHLAAAMQTPVVAVFGPSNWRAWGPYTPVGEESPHTIVSRDLPCMPCFYRGHDLGLREGCGTRPCLTGLSHVPVLRACRETLDRVKADAKATGT